MYDITGKPYNRSRINLIKLLLWNLPVQFVYTGTVIKNVKHRFTGRLRRRTNKICVKYLKLALFSRNSSRITVGI